MVELLITLLQQILGLLSDISLLTLCHTFFVVCQNILAIVGNTMSSDLQMTALVLVLVNQVSKPNYVNILTHSTLTFSNCKRRPTYGHSGWVKVHVQWSWRIHTD